MARQRHAVPSQQPHGLLLGHARLQPEQQLPHALGGVAGGVLEQGELLRLVDDPEAVGGADEQVGGVLDVAGATDGAQLVDDEGGQVAGRPVAEQLPADQPDPAPGGDALGTQDLPQGA
jgi:hypothetical protein